MKIKTKTKYQWLIELWPYSHYVLGAMPILLFTLYSTKIRIQGKYFGAILMSSRRTLESATIFDVLFLYRYDLLLWGCLAPIAIIVSYRYLRHKNATIIWVAISILSLLLLYTNLQSWGQVGQFLTFSALVDAVSFGISKPDIAKKYIAMDGVIKTLVLILASTVAFCGGNWLKHFKKIQKLVAWISISSVLVFLMMACSANLSTLRSSTITNSFFMNALFSLLSSNEGKTTLDNLSEIELNKRFFALHGLSDTTQPPLNYAVERNSNLILFVLETASINFLDVRKALPNHPVWNKLSANKYIGANHYSVFPASAESNLAMLTGLYPPRAYYDSCLINLTADKTIPSIITAFTKLGASTGVYVPYKSQVPMDKVVFEHVGFKKVFYGEEHRLANLKNADIIAFNELDADISHWTKEGTRFAVGFYPQRGHGPWDTALGASVAERGHKIAMQQLDWLLALVNRLEENGALSKTVIVLTGDHGVRTSEEDPNVRIGMIDQYSFHVPLIFIAPHAHYPAEVSNKPTSHIDIAAEITHLFGLPRDKLQQGLAFLDVDINKRHQFFVANWYYGADGYRTPTTSAMYSKVLDIAFENKNTVLKFSDMDIVTTQGEKNRIQQHIDNMLDLQTEWIKRYACDAA